MDEASKINELSKQVEKLELENAMLRRDFSSLAKGNTVNVPDAMKPLFDLAQKNVGEYFRELKMDPTHGTIEINDQRYILIRASALSTDFSSTMQKLYADKGEREAFIIGKNFLFDVERTAKLRAKMAGFEDCGAVVFIDEAEQLFGKRETGTS